MSHNYFESLELRTFLDATLTNGVLQVTGTNAGETINIDINANQITANVGGTATQFDAAQVTSITIDPEVIDPEDAEMLSDLVLAAVQQGLQSAQDHAAKKMAPLTGGLGGMGLPGF